MDDLELQINELTDNPSARVPVCLCLDVSGSMHGEPIKELNEGVAQFFNAVRGDKQARYSADICIVTFGSEANKVLNFQSVDRQIVPVLEAGGSTSMGQAVNLALDALEDRKLMYNTSGNDYYQPWLVIMTDGHPTDEVDGAIQRVSDLVNSKKLTVFPIGIGTSADMGQLAKFSPNRPPLKLKGLAFNEFFSWLSKSIVRTSTSSVGESVSLPPVNPWATL